MADIVRFGTQTPTQDTTSRWNVIRNGKYENLVREYLDEMGNIVSEKDVKNKLNDKGFIDIEWIRKEIPSWEK